MDFLLWPLESFFIFSTLFLTSTSIPQLEWPVSHDHGSSSHSVSLTVSLTQVALGTSVYTNSLLAKNRIFLSYQLIFPKWFLWSMGCWISQIKELWGSGAWSNSTKSQIADWVTMETECRQAVLKISCCPSSTFWAK